MKVNSVSKAVDLFFRLATLRKRKKLVGVNKDSQVEHPRYKL